jgi:putative flippase GtrA
MSFRRMLAMPTKAKGDISKQRVSGPARFITSGVLNTAITYVLFLILARFLGMSAAYTLTYAVGIAIAYFLNTFFVFRTGHSKRMVIAVPVSYLIQYFYGLSALNILTQVFRLPVYIAIVIVVASSFPLQFFILQFAAHPSVIKRTGQMND